MSRARSIRWRLVAALFAAFAALPGARLYAGQLRPYDLDSLVHLSTEVAEVEITRGLRPHAIDSIEVMVTLVHKGGFKKGQIVTVANTYIYKKPEKRGLNSDPLAVGDRLALFVVRAKPSRSSPNPGNAVIYEPLGGGMRLIQHDYVFDFFQRSNPGPYVASVGPYSSKGQLLTVERFREQVRDSLRHTKEWARLVEAEQDKLDVPRLLKLLEDRLRQPYRGYDYFAGRICLRFAESHDVDILSRALAVTDRGWLHIGFGTPQGRDYLLAKITDVNGPMPARLRYVNALKGAGEVYRSTLKIDKGSCYIVGEADEGNSGYLTRIAKAALATRNHEELCGSLVRCLDFFGGGIVQNKPAPMMADLRGALATLKELYDAKPSESLQFAIEKAATNVPEVYEMLKSPCGPFISILRPADPAKYVRHEKPSLIFEYGCNTALSGREAEMHLSVVLVHQRTKKRYVLPARLQIRGWSMGYQNPYWTGEGGTNSVELPKDLLPGRYHVFLQLSDGDKVISTGHYFATDL
jgi:hypothetical protein